MRYVIAVIFFLFFWSCDKEDPTLCGCRQLNMVGSLAHNMEASIPSEWKYKLSRKSDVDHPIRVHTYDFSNLEYKRKGLKGNGFLVFLQVHAQYADSETFTINSSFDLEVYYKDKKVLETVIDLKATDGLNPTLSVSDDALESDAYFFYDNEDWSNQKYLVLDLKKLMSEHKSAKP